MRLGMVSTYPPRRCGVANYAGELGRALSRQFEVVVCAVDQDRLTYPDEVVAVIRPGRRRATVEPRAFSPSTLSTRYWFSTPTASTAGRRAPMCSGSPMSCVCAASPYLVTLHSLPNVELHARTATALAQGAAGVTVFTETARGLLTSVGDCGPRGAHAAWRARRRQPGGQPGPRPKSVPPARASARGWPPVGRGAPARRRPELSPLLSTFGLLRPGKGLERAIAAMPSVLAAHPGARYLIVGETHPDEAREHGEAYRDSVRRLIDRLELAPSVRLLDAYLTNDELLALLGRTDVYLAPGMRADAATSGTLALAVAAGCPGGGGRASVRL